jgi:hypothetical protein
MEIVTTINPNGRYERQRYCIDSWHTYDLPIYALQLPEEANIVAELFPDVTILEAKPKENVWSKNTPSFDSFTALFSRKHSLLVNSDVELNYSKEDFEKLWVSPDTNKLVCAVRYDVTADNKKTFNPYGIDVFRFTPEMLGTIPQSNFCFGMPGWDYWVPFYLMTKAKFGIRTYFHTGVRHEEHQDRWNKTDQNTAWRELEKSCGWSHKNITLWIQQKTGRNLWKRQSLSVHTRRILNGLRTVFEV